MRLYLSSYRFGNRPDELASLVPTGVVKRASVILNALDNFGDKRSAFLSSDISTLAEAGFTTTELDLRKYFGKRDALADHLAAIDLVWVTGGNTFLLRRAMGQSGFDHLIRELVVSDAIAYGGFSAGAIVVTPTLHGVDLLDEPHEVPAGYDEDVIWDGIGLVNFCIAVHHNSSDPEWAHRAERYIEYLLRNNLSYKTLSDGQVLMKRGSKLTLIE